MEESIITQPEEETEQLSETDLIEMVRAKHREPLNEEHLSDVFVTQLCICIIIILILVVTNIFYPDISHWFTEKIKTSSNGETEKILADAVNKAMEYVK